MSSGGPPTKDQRAARQKEELEKKKKREAEWAAMHPPWFTAIIRNDVAALQALLREPGFNLEQRYVVITDTTPLGWATIADRGECCALLVEAGASLDAEIKFWGNQTWKPKDYCVHYSVKKALNALETAKRQEKKMEAGVDFD
jgi:hypothetical protein